MTTATDKRTGRKRGNGEGSVYRRKDGTWAAALMVGHKPDGRPDRRTVYGRTRADVVKKLDELRGRKSAGLVTEPTRLTVAIYLSQWLKHTVTIENRASTAIRYELNIRLHIAPAIGHLKLTALKPAHIQRIYADMLAAGFSPSTVRLQHAI